MNTVEIYPFIFRNPISAATHLAGCLFAAYVTALLWKLTRGEPGKRLSVVCFGICATLLYAASATYHAVGIDNRVSVVVEERILHFIRLLDHSAIYLLIAGTYTPIFTVLLRGRLRVGMLALVWGLAAVGIACKWIFTPPPYPVTVSLYIAMGWVGILPAYHLIKAVGWKAMGLGLAGGVLYTAGGVFDTVNWPVLLPGVIGGHEMLHVCDLGGTFAHVFFLFRYILPFRAPIG